ncbi:MAG: nucleoside deaminase [Candidatus Competibacteraceae bacterium]|nr:nucleoside deaminase [Candidatus Competibacteraceae bacterium]
MFSDAHFMREAIREARKAADVDEIPIGCVIVQNSRIVARAHNLTETLNDATAHAEMQAITAASNHVGSKYLPDCILYVTLEPCLMCAGAIRWSQIGRVVFGCYDKKYGFARFATEIAHPKADISGGVLQDECSALLTEFFKAKRIN